jgi:hypothetical protein
MHTFVVLADRPVRAVARIDHWNGLSQSEMNQTEKDGSAKMTN